MPSSFTRTLRLKVRPESYGWLNAAAVEVNQTFNFCNEASWLAATRTDSKRKWLSGFDLCGLTAGASRYFERIGADTIQRICVEYAQKRTAVQRRKLRWRISRGSRRSLGWVPLKAASLKRKGRSLRFCDKGEHAGRTVIVVSERNTTRACSFCGASTGPTGMGMLVVRYWDCPECGAGHDRDQNSGRNIRYTGLSKLASVGGNELLQEVARRLPRAARRVVYGESIPPSGPIPLRVIRNSQEITIEFGDVEKTLVAYSHDKPIGFELCADAPGSCRFAEAEIAGSHVKLAVTTSLLPTRVRYCWADSPICTLFDASGLPAGPFELRLQ